MIQGVLDISLWGFVIAALVLTHITIASVTIFLHRHQAHNALTLHPVISHFFRLWLWLTTGITTKEWVAVHRKHHAKCETREDPHSPQVEGIWRVLFGGVILYKHAARDQDMLERYGKGTPDDWLERNVYARHTWVGILIMLSVDLLLFGTAGLVIFGVQMVWIPFWAAGVINGLGHYLGYRNCETPDASRNLTPIGILIGGEELHNNHHAYAQSARLSNKWWEFDIGWMYIKTLALLGLARVHRVAPKVRILRDKPVIDHETLRAVIRDRYHILSLYSRNVIRPIVRIECQECDRARKKLMGRVRKLMSREEIKFDLRSRATLDEALQLSQKLETVYRFKLQLKELWTSTTGDGAKRLERLKQWCTEAEQSGIEALQEFSLILRGYTLKPA